MKRYLACGCILGLVALAALPSWAQRSGGAGGGGTSRPPSQPGTSIPGTPGGPQPGLGQPGGPPINQNPLPLYVNGRILMENGQQVPESVSVGLYCGVRAVQVIRTDLGGYFTFTLGAGTQSNVDFSASDESPMAIGGYGTNTPGMYGRGGGISGSSGSSLNGCEVRASVPGYQPLTYTIADPADMGRIEVGTLRLQRIAGVQGSAISVTSLLVPGNARKEYERALKDERSNHTDSARQHLEKAVAAYDKYAAAWNQLGAIYLSSHNHEKAGQAFERAIAADPQYIPPYLSLAALRLQNKQYAGAVEAAGKVLELDSSVGYASFLQAVGNFNLNQMDAAEKAARDAEKGPHQSFPQVHALLAQILLQKQDNANAAIQMREYLKEAPSGPFAADMKKDLGQIEQQTGSASVEPGKAGGNNNP